MNTSAASASSVEWCCPSFWSSGPGTRRASRSITGPSRLFSRGDGDRTGEGRGGSASARRLGGRAPGNVAVARSRGRDTDRCHIRRSRLTAHRQGGVFQPHGAKAFSYLGHAALSLLLAIGMSWAIVRRKLTGQVEVDTERGSLFSDRERLDAP